MAPNRYYSSIAAATTLTSGITSVATVISVGSTSGFPTSTPYTLVVDGGTSAEEIVTVTGASGLNLTVTRGDDGSSATSHLAGATVRHMMTARDLREPQQHLGSNSGVHGVSGSVVGTTDTQTLTNKTLTSPNINGGTVSSATLTTPTIADFTNAQHAHTSAATGGLITKPVQVAFHIANSLTTGVKNPKFVANQAMTLRSARAILAAGSGATFQVYVNGVAPAGMTTSPSVGTTVVQHDFTDVVLAVGDYVQVNVISAGTSASELSITIDAVA